VEEGMAFLWDLIRFLLISSALLIVIPFILIIIRLGVFFVSLFVL